MIYKKGSFVIERRVKNSPFVMCVLLRGDFNTKTDVNANYENYFTVVLKKRNKGERVFKCVTKEYDDNIGGYVSFDGNGAHVPCKKIIEECKRLLEMKVYD